MRRAPIPMVIAGVAASLGILAACTPQGDLAPEQPAPTSGPVATPAAPSSAAVTPDPWAGYFDEEARANQREVPTQFWGSFGDVGGVAVNRSENQTLEPGGYAVTVRCEGPDGLTVTVETSAGTRLGDPVAVACPAATTLPVDLTERGLVVMLDSGGQAGAYLIGISPTS
ncbi:hypothetical protein [Microbacterium oleivorans]|uniref:Lipoprotein n=1 Tax=Microbacterium oleivorans TaxID=273677 RepID=A0A7D5IZW4_9MICO|nr:hypothetical protein [Microbacterium oleivorans]QLD12295.1 hypothetical protein HW566_11230 [Microbacterium oleivorans]